MADKAFRPPVSNDPRDNELAFNRLNSKISEQSSLIETLQAGQSTAEELQETFAEVSATVTANKEEADAAIAANAAAIDAAIADFESALAGKVDVDGTLTNFGSIIDLYSTYKYAVPSGNVTQSQYNTDIAPAIDTEFTYIITQINNLAAKVDAIQAIIRND